MSESEVSYVIYADRKNGRFYRIPKGVSLPEGAVEVRDLMGNRLKVDETVIAVYEIDEQEAKELAREFMGKMTRRAGHFVTRTATMLREVSNGEIPTVPTPDPKKQRETIADALGVTPEQLTTDPDALMRGLVDVISGVSEALRDGARERPKVPDTLQKQMEALVEGVRTEFGDDVGSRVEELPEKLASYLRNPELEQGVRKATARLRSLSAQLRAGVDFQDLEADLDPPEEGESAGEGERAAGATEEGDPA